MPKSDDKDLNAPQLVAFWTALALDPTGIQRNVVNTLPQDAHLLGDEFNDSRVFMRHCYPPIAGSLLGSDP